MSTWLDDNPNSTSAGPSTYYQQQQNIHSGLSEYSPISTLLSQGYATNNNDGKGSRSTSAAAAATTPGGRLFLFVQGNPQCCLKGGVEGLLKQGSTSKGQRSLIISGGGSSGDVAVVDPIQDSNHSSGSNSDPFGFLNSDGGVEEAAGAAGPPKKTSVVKNPFGFIKKVAQSTSKSLERGIQTLAIRADQGRNPDLLTVGLYTINTQTNKEFLVNCTEAVPLPVEADRLRSGLCYKIPLVVPSNLPNEQTVTIRLWIRSGAKILQQTKAFAKNFLIGSVTLSVGHLRQVAQNSIMSARPSFLTVSLQSDMIADGMLSLCVASDLKHPFLCGRGWSLVDPMVQAYLSPQCPFFLPLDASYAFHIPLSTTTIAFNNPVVLATERTTESTVVLPIASAWAQLCRKAATVSAQRAQYYANKLHYNRHDTSAAPEAVTVSIGVANVKPVVIDAVSHAVSYTKAPTLTIAWQRPDSIFETEVLAATKIPLSATASTTTTSPPVLVTTAVLHAKPARDNILPVVWQACGNKLPPGSGFCLGSLRFFVALPVRQRATMKSEQIASSSLNNPFSSFTSVGSSFTNAGTSAFNSAGNMVAAVNPFGSFTGMNASSSSGTTDNTTNPAAANSAAVSTTSGSDNPFASPPPQGTSPQESTPATPSSQSQGIVEPMAPIEDSLGEFVLGLDTLLQSPPPAEQVLEYPFYDVGNRQIGTIGLVIKIQYQQDPVAAASSQQLPVPQSSSTSMVAPPTPAKDGLVSLVGLSHFPQASSAPYVDFDPFLPQDPMQQKRQAQLATMGDFMSSVYLQQHLSVLRGPDLSATKARADAYLDALICVQQQAPQQQLPGEEVVMPNELKIPRPFRPSSSRMEAVLSGLPFNVHTATMSLSLLEPALQKQQVQPNEPPKGDMFFNTTCGAPADHARDFGNIFTGSSSSSSSSHSNKEGSLSSNSSSVKSVAVNSPVGSVSGGLRRLEAKRQEIAEHVTGLQTYMMKEIARYFQTSNLRGMKVNYIPARHHEIGTLRWRMIEAVQALHHVTWHCAVRRANVFSQALGIAVSTYLTALSDPIKWNSTWPALWSQHGFLLSFEGLLSAAGKELGMIEDASVGIRMLRMVRVVLVSDDGNAASSTYGTDCIPVPSSPYLKWFRLTTNDPNSPMEQREFLLHVGMVSSYYDQRVPAALKNGVPVRFCPLLFEVGVDIRQWGANVTGSLDKAAAGERNSGREVSSNSASSADAAQPAGLIDDEDDDVGVSDEDVLVQLNYEAFQQLNIYAYLISPANSQQTQAANRTHPLLETLYQHIVSSAGKMNHDILVEASTLVNQLGGSAAIFCKSGKDRTAMHVTFKQAKFVNEFCARTSKSFELATVASSFSNDGNTVPWLDTTSQDATLIRIYGTRLPICEKNVGQALFAFNSLQVRFMPEALQPPMNTLAGFLKGGKVFTGGAIES